MQQKVNLFLFQNFKFISLGYTLLKHSYFAILQHHILLQDKAFVSIGSF